MAKFLLTSILIMTIALPMRYAKAKEARAGLRKTMLGATLYVFFWVFFCVYIYTTIRSE